MNIDYIVGAKNRPQLPILLISSEILADPNGDPFKGNALYFSGDHNLESAVELNEGIVTPNDYASVTEKLAKQWAQCGGVPDRLTICVEERDFSNLKGIIPAITNYVSVLQTGPPSYQLPRLDVDLIDGHPIGI